MIVLTVQWLANIGEEDKVRDLFLQLADSSRKEPGCKLYLVHQHRDNRRRFFLYEQYENDAALQAHRESPHFQTIGMQHLPEVAKRIEGELYSLL